MSLQVVEAIRSSMQVPSQAQIVHLAGGQPPAGLIDRQSPAAMITFARS